jgi:hypothetical protein
MVESIVAVGSQAGTGLITFMVNVDKDGCDEVFSVTIDGDKFAKHVKHGPEDHPSDCIQTTKAGVGPRNIRIHAEGSDVWSADRLVVL